MTDKITLTPEQLEKAQQMLSDGIPMAHVADALGISVRTLKRRLEEWQEANGSATSSSEEEHQENGQTQGWRPENPEDYKYFSPQHFSQIAPSRSWEGPLSLQPLRDSSCPELQSALSDWELFCARVATLAEYLREDATRPGFPNYFGHTPREFASFAASTLIKRLESAAVEVRRGLDRGINAAIEHECRLVVSKLQEELRQAQADPEFWVPMELARLWRAMGEAKHGYLFAPPPPPAKPLALALFARLDLGLNLHAKILSGDRLTLALLTGALGEEEATQLQRRIQQLNQALIRLRSLSVAQLFAPLRSVASSLTTTIR